MSARALSQRGNCTSGQQRADIRSPRDRSARSRLSNGSRTSSRLLQADLVNVAMLNSRKIFQRKQLLPVSQKIDQRQRELANDSVESIGALGITARMEIKSAKVLNSSEVERQTKLLKKHELLLSHLQPQETSMAHELPQASPRNLHTLKRF